RDQGRHRQALDREPAPVLRRGQAARGGVAAARALLALWAMQRIEATFAAERLDEIMNAVLDLRVPCHMTACEVGDADGRVRHEHEYRGVRSTARWEMRARLEVIVADREAKAVIDLLCARLDDDRKKDEALIITEVDDTLRIRSARRGPIAF